MHFRTEISNPDCIRSPMTPEEVTILIYKQMSVHTSIFMWFLRGWWSALIRYEVKDVSGAVTADTITLAYLFQSVLEVHRTLSNTGGLCLPRPLCQRCHSAQSDIKTGVFIINRCARLIAGQSKAFGWCTTYMWVSTWSFSCFETLRVKLIKQIPFSVFGMDCQLSRLVSFIVGQLKMNISASDFEEGPSFSVDFKPKCAWKCCWWDSAFPSGIAYRVTFLGNPVMWHFRVSSTVDCVQQYRIFGIPAELLVECRERPAKCKGISSSLKEGQLTGLPMLHPAYLCSWLWSFVGALFLLVFQWTNLPMSN